MARDKLKAIEEREESMIAEDFPKYMKEIIIALDLNPKARDVRRAAKEALEESTDVGDFTVFRTEMTQFAGE